MYYNTLSRLLFLESEDGEKFTKFMEPLANTLNSLWQQCLANQPALRADQFKNPLVGICRDLRGVCQACTSNEPYNMLFEWLVDQPKNPQMSRVQLFSKALEVWWDDHEVTTPLLKFMAELMLNKGQRIHFENTSPNGILLFREAASILQSTLFKTLLRFLHL